MPAPRKYPQEVRERAMRLVAEARKEDPGLSLNRAVVRIGQRVGVNPDTMRVGASRPRSMPGSVWGRRLLMRSGSSSWSRRIVS